jgi:hypothetical protein
MRNQNPRRPSKSKPKDWEENIRGGCQRPHTAKNLDAAEEKFITLGLTPEKATALRGELERNKIADTVISLVVEVAATFRNHPLRKD